MSACIIVGHSGSGKTEFAANYALWLLKSGRAPVIADMDIVNPYFRLREKAAKYAELGIETISSYYPGDMHLDAPAMNAGLRYCFETAENSVIDVGGDAAGAVVLVQQARYLRGREYDMWMAVNAMRPKTATAEGVAEYIDAIESVSGLRVNGLLNTTHMLGETVEDDILRGDALVREVAGVRGLGVKYVVYEKRIEKDIEKLNLAGERFPIKLQMRAEWMMV